MKIYLENDPPKKEKKRDEDLNSKYGSIIKLIYFIIFHNPSKFQRKELLAI